MAWLRPPLPGQRLTAFYQSCDSHAAVHNMFNRCGKAGYVAVLPNGIADNFNTSLASLSCHVYIVCTLMSC